MFTNVPRIYGLLAQVLLTIAWVALFFTMIWFQGTGRPVHPLIFIIALISIIGSGIVTFAMATALPEYWNSLEEVVELKDELQKAITGYDQAKEELAKHILKEDYPQGEPTYRQGL